MDLFEFITIIAIHLGNIFSKTLLFNPYSGLACKDVLVPTFQGASAQELSNMPRAKEKPVFHLWIYFFVLLFLGPLLSLV